MMTIYWSSDTANTVRIYGKNDIYLVTVVTVLRYLIKKNNSSILCAGVRLPNLVTLPSCFFKVGALVGVNRS
jgi:hypothetical protein